MIKFKKILVLVLLIVLISSSTIAAADKLSMWVFPLTQNTREDFQPMLDSFEEKTGIEVELTTIPWGDGNQKILTAIAAGNAPDVMYTTMSRVLPLVEFGDALAPLNEFLTEEYKNNVFADTSSLNNYTLDGKTYAVPFLGGHHRWGINTKLFKEAGLESEISKMTDPNKSWSWDDLRKWAPQLTMDSNDDGTLDSYGFIYPGGSTQASTFLHHFWNIGGRVLSDNNEVLVGDEKTVETLKLIQDLIDDGVMPPGVENITPSEVNGLFTEGQLAISVGFPLNQLLRLQSDGRDVSQYLTVYPPEAPNGTRGSFVAWDALAISSQADVDTAWQLVDHFLQSEYWTEYLVDLGFFPVSGINLNDVENNYYRESLEVTQNILNMEQYDYIRHELLHPMGTQIMRVLNTETQAVIMQDKTPEEAAETMREKVKNIIKD